MAEDSGFRDIKRKPKPGWERWRPPPLDRWARSGFRGKTVWDWLELLIVPLMLALITVVITVAFTWQQNVRQNDIEDRRAKAERKLTEQRAQDEALQAYLDQMSQLILDRKLLEAEEGDAVYSLAQARTATVIARVDAKHNESVARFLTDSGLTTFGESSVALLKGIELQGARLSGVTLENANLIDANLRGADLSNADLSNANLNGAELVGANLRGANLLAADLSGPRLAEKVGSLKKGTYWPYGADLENANLYSADLYSANLSDALLDGTDLTYADLTKADLSNTYLVGADLSEARGVTNEELEQQARALEGATMPNGQKYEDWLKAR